MLLEKEMKLADVIHHDYNLVPIINRFGIMLGFGDDSIEAICKKEQINIDFFLTILNAFHDPQYLDNDYLQSFSASLLIDYLQKTHRYYLQNKIPEIEGLIKEMKSEFELDNVSYNLLQKFFIEYKNELINHIENEENRVYPYVIDLENAGHGHPISATLISRIKKYPIHSYEAEHEDVEEKLTDLKNIIIKYLPPSKSQRIRFRLLKELTVLEKDLNDHARIEDLILVPKVEILENLVISKQHL
ncbi:MAG: hemerythrin domain-containing protein [Bacteroidetes bacterium]|nr:hemerythrin domain-containing protein [Bacteroidota bacterium]MBL6943438.1 hemerythrin domain-containing protein [Bacteroidales bacterium]